MYQTLKKDCTGTFPGEVVTSRYDGESHEDYRQRRREFNELLRGKRIEIFSTRGTETIRTKGYKGGTMFWNSGKKGTYVKPSQTIPSEVKIAA